MFRSQIDNRHCFNDLVAMVALKPANLSIQPTALSLFSSRDGLKPRTAGPG
jgi:hypothetical protein